MQYEKLSLASQPFVEDVNYDFGDCLEQHLESEAICRLLWHEEIYGQSKMRTCTGLKHFINFNQGYSAFVLNELKEVKNHCCCCRTNVITEMEGLVGHLGISVGPDGDIFILAQLLYQQISDRDGEAELSF